VICYRVFSTILKAPSFVERFDDLITRARTIHEARNRVVHSWWFTDHIGEASRLKPKRKSIQFDSDDIDMNAIAFSIDALMDDFAKFVDELHENRLIRRTTGISLSLLL